MGPVVWFFPLAGAHSRGVMSYLRDLSFDVRECDPELGPSGAEDAVSRGVLVVDLDELNEDVGNPCRFSEAGLPRFFLLPGGVELGGWLCRCPVDSFAIKPVSLEAIEEYLKVLFRQVYDSPPEVTPAAGSLSRDASGVGLNPFPVQSGVVIDEEAKRVRVAGKEVRLTPKEFDLLSLLASRPGHVFSVDEIVARVWKGRRRASSLDVQQYVHHLRRKLERDPRSPRWIRNVKGFGYLLDCGSTA